MIYLITYDKGNILKDYTPFRNAIKGCTSAWWHHMDNTWLIRSNLSANEIYNQLYLYLNQTDKILIIEVADNYQGWLNEEAWNWIRNQFDRDHPANPFYRGAI